MAGAKPNTLLLLPRGWAGLDPAIFAHDAFTTLIEGRDAYAPADIDYLVGFRPPPGFVASLPRLRAVFSLGAGVDGFLKDPAYPRHVPLVRSVDAGLATQMAEYVALHVLSIYRHQHFFAARQAEAKWKQKLLARAPGEVRVGLLGLGTIATVIAQRLAGFGFALSGWSRSHKDVAGVESFAGADALPRFLAGCDILVCVLPLTPDTHGILNARLFAELPQGAHIINVARGEHLVEADLIAALDSDHLAGAVLDVFETEPLPPDHPFWAHPKVVVTPHIAGITDPGAAMAYVARGIAQVEAGAILDNLVDIERGY